MNYLSIEVPDLILPNGYGSINKLLSAVFIQNSHNPESLGNDAVSLPFSETKIQANGVEA